MTAQTRSRPAHQRTTAAWELCVLVRRGVATLVSTATGPGHRRPESMSPKTVSSSIGVWPVATRAPSSSTSCAVRPVGTSCRPAPSARRRRRSGPQAPARPAAPSGRRSGRPSSSCGLHRERDTSRFPERSYFRSWTAGGRPGCCPSVWQVGQYCIDLSAKDTSRTVSPHTGQGKPVRACTASPLRFSRLQGGRALPDRPLRPRRSGLVTHGRVERADPRPRSAPAAIPNGDSLAACRISSE